MSDIIGYINFDQQDTKNNIVQGLVSKEKINQLKLNKFIKILEYFDKEKKEYLGRVIGGPFFIPEEIDKNSAFAQISILHGDEFPIPPNYYAVYTIEIVGILDQDSRLKGSGSKPLPRSMIYPLTSEEINTILNLKDGDMLMGNLEGYNDVFVRFVSDKINVLPRNLGIFGTVGSGKTNTAQVLIEELNKSGWSVIILDVEGEYTEMNFPNPVQYETNELFSKYNLKPEGIKDFHVLKLCNQDGTIDAEEEVTITTKDIEPYILGEILDTTEPQMSGLLNVIEELSKNPERKQDDDKIFSPKANSSGYTLNGIIEAIGRKIETRDRSDKDVTNATWYALRRKLKSLNQSSKAFDDPSALKINPTELIKPGRVTVFDLAYTDDMAKNLLTAQILRRIFYEKVNDRKNSLPPTMIIIEEAHTFISRENKDKMVETMRMIKEIARRGRKRWLGLCFISQQPSHLPPEIFELANTRIVHNIRSHQNLEIIKSTSGDIGEETWNAVPGLDPGQAIINGPQFRNSIIVKVRYPKSKRRKNE